ncbi:MAG: hypothetical protein AAF787_11330 [Chloroflexota bacterium]
MTTAPETYSTTDAPARLRRLSLIRADMLFYALVVLAGVLVFILQAPNVGFYGPNHGWTSSHGLAISSHATPGNGFVGHALQFRDADGNTEYEYFDRYPFFFSAMLGGLLSMTDNAAWQVQLARQAMNAVYVATLVVAGLLAYTLTGNRWRALAAVLLAFSGWWLVFYKDMIHYDQPALFGNFLLLLAIARYGPNQRVWPVYAAALIAVSLGRGYSSYMILALWTAWQLIAGIRKHGRGMASPLQLVRLTSVRVFTSAIVWGALFLGYNLVIEMVRRGVPFAETSIVDSALRRLPVFGEKEFGRTVGKDVLPWGEFARVEFVRLVRWTLPWRVDGETALVWAFGVVMVAVASGYIWRQRGKQRQTAFFTALWGVFWLAFMINLAHGHEYVVMYGIGLPLVFYVAIASWLPSHRVVTMALLVIAFSASIYSQWSVRTLLTDDSINRAVYTYDYSRIQERIAGEGRNVLVNVSDGRCLIEDDYCYVAGFYLDNHYLTLPENAEYVVSRLPYYWAHPLFLAPGDDNGLLLARDSVTPENTTAHLFDLSTAQPRTLPDDAQTMFTFGESLTLQHWALTDSVTVKPCQRAHVESWWMAERELPANYSMQLALVDSGGAGVAQTNTDLTILPTQVWVPGMYHIDARYVTVPCDITPGDYALVMSVYDPDADASLTVTAVDGTPNGDFLYLTTLFVE